MRRALAAIIAAAIFAVGLATPASASWSWFRPPSQSLTDLVVASGDFDDNSRDHDTLLKALLLADTEGAGLVAALGGEGSFTVFGPNDGAFARLAADLGFEGGTEAETWDFLVNALVGVFGDEAIATLTAVLTYHVAPENLNAFEVLFRRGPIDTLNGETIGGRWLTLVDKDPGLKNPRVTWPLQKKATNGVFHSIDRVLIPVNLTAIVAG